MQQDKNYDMLTKANIINPVKDLINNQRPHILLGMRLVEKIDRFPELTDEEKKLQMSFRLNRILLVCPCISITLSHIHALQAMEWTNPFYTASKRAKMVMNQPFKP